MSSLLRRCGLAGLLFFFACAEPPPDEIASAPPGAPASAPAPVAAGEATFQQYCASCHGTEATGGGPVAEALATPLPDLTRLAVRRGGTYPADEVYRYIDGRAEVAAHGTRTMPVWGNNWSETIDGEPVPEARVDQRIRELVEYLRSIQRPAPDPAGG